MTMIRTNDLDAQDMRSLMSALSNAQRITRLSLGASVSNEIIQTATLTEPEIDWSQFSDEELEQFRGFLRRCCVPVNGNHQ